MKKLFAVLLLLCSASLFAEQFVIKIGDSHESLTTQDYFIENQSINEIFPVNDNLCKIVYSDGVVEYLKKGDFIEITRKDIDVEDSLELVTTVTKYKIIGFTYNKITTEIVDKKEKREPYRLGIKL